MTFPEVAATSYTIEIAAATLTSSWHREAVKALLDADATPSGGKSLDLSSHDAHPREHLQHALEDLERLNFVHRQVGDGAHTSWSLTVRGVASLVASQKLQKSKPALQPRDLPVAEWDQYELMLYLRSNGWSPSPWAKNCRRPAALTFKREAPAAGSGEVPVVLPPESNIWYFRPFQTFVPWAYLCAMVHF